MTLKEACTVGNSTMGLRLHTSNQLEILAERLAEVLSSPLGSPLDEEIIVVQSKGMERWVSMELAQRHGICANCRFPFPNAFLYEAFRKILPDLPERSPFDPGIVTWKVMKLLPFCIPKPEFESIRGYLGDGDGNLKRFMLSERIADAFDQYILFRPEMILQWDNHRPKHWQAMLWRELVRETEGSHCAALREAFFAALNRRSAEIQNLPERVSVFGISALPRFHMEVFAAISQFTQLNLFLMEAWRSGQGDSLSDRETKRAIDTKSLRDLGTDEISLKKGNSLLASMGKLGKDFVALIQTFKCEKIPLFEDPGDGSLLSCIQSDILNLRETTRCSDGKKWVSESDNSVEIHSCHSPMREMEILHDRLLDLFEKNPHLTPKDILVMTPDIEAYAPYIQAVFDIPMNSPKRIPFSIADRSIRRESEIVDSFLGILDLWGSRFGASQVLAALESRAVRRKFGLSETDLDLIRRWVKETGIRWGIDGKSRAQLGLPNFQENTWQAGLDRLLLGYAMAGQDENMFGGVLPYDHIEGSEVSVLGKLLHFLTQLFAHTSSLGQSRTLEEWSGTLTALLESFFMPEEDTEREIQAIRRTLNDLVDMQDLSGFDEKIEIDVVKWYLGQYLEKEGFGFGFMTGSLTFCAMLPMRSIPFKIICLVGMSIDAYPRQSRILGFDLMARDPKPGDRSRRDDDRYLFLEAVLSAREKLYVSYVGQSIRDNSPIPPSVLVSELMDAIEQNFEIPGRNILNHIITEHRLQPFSPEYFKENQKLFSYSEENFRAAQCTQESCQAMPFISEKGLPDPTEEWKVVDVTDLCSFFSNPAKFLLNRRLGVHLEEKSAILEEHEAFQIRGLEKYHLERNLAEKGFARKDLGDFLPPTRASGRLPHGTVGTCFYDALSRRIESFVEKTRPYMKGPPCRSLEVDLKISGFKLTGRIEGLQTERLLHYRYAKVNSKDRLRTWIYHLVLNSLKADGYPEISMLVGLDPNSQESEWAAWEYSPTDAGEEIIGRLLERYGEGFIRPLHFFPESSWQYARSVLGKNQSEEHALRWARKTWTGSGYGWSESEDPYYQVCFGETDPLDLGFQRLAKEVFGPLLRHQMDVSV